MEVELNMNHGDDLDDMAAPVRVQEVQIACVFLGALRTLISCVAIRVKSFDTSLYHACGNFTLGISRLYPSANSHVE